jgi:hypothetical protein
MLTSAAIVNGLPRSKIAQYKHTYLPLLKTEWVRALAR